MCRDSGFLSFLHHNYQVSLRESWGSIMLPACLLASHCITGITWLHNEKSSKYFATMELLRAKGTIFDLCFLEENWYTQKNIAIHQIDISTCIIQIVDNYRLLLAVTQKISFEQNSRVPSSRYFVCTFHQVDKRTWIKMLFLQCTRTHCGDENIIKPRVKEIKDVLHRYRSHSIYV